MSLDVNMSEPEEFNSTELHTSIQEVAKLKGIEEFVYNVNFACGKDENFVANVFRVSIKDVKDEEKYTNVVVKTLVNTTRQELFHELHRREVIVYREVLPKFMQIQCNIDKDSRLFLPESIYSRIEKGYEILILEDYNTKGFLMDDKLSKYETLEYLQVRLVMTELAKFHALGFALETNDPDKLEELKTELKDLVFQEDFVNKSKLRHYFSDAFSKAVKMIHDDEARKKLGDVEPKLLEFLRQCVKATSCSVLCHGDCWINNMLFRHQDSKPSQVCFIDFQAMRFACPVTDIVYFFYLCTDSKFRSEYLQTLTAVYYDTLKSFLNKLDIEVTTIYPRQVFDDDIESLLPFGLIIALIELRIIDEDVNEETNVAPFCSINDSRVNMHAIKINDVVNESIENGVLDKLITQIKNIL